MGLKLVYVIKLMLHINLITMSAWSVFTLTDLEALHIRQRRLRCDRFVLRSVGLETLHHIQLRLRGLGSDFIVHAPLLLRPQLVGRHLAC